MKNKNEINLRSLMPSSSSIIIAYAFAVWFLAVAYFMHPLTSAFSFGMIGAAWLARAVEKTSLRRKILRLMGIDEVEDGTDL